MSQTNKLFGDVYLDSHKSYSLLGTDADGKVVPFGDENTGVEKDESGNLTFKDANAGTITLTALKSMRNIWINTTCVWGAGDDDFTISDATNWNAQYSHISSIKVVTANTNWDLWLCETSAFNTGLITSRKLAANRNGNYDITVAREYNSDGTNVYLKFVDNNGDGEDYAVLVNGEARRH